MHTISRAQLAQFLHELFTPSKPSGYTHTAFKSDLNQISFTQIWPESTVIWLCEQHQSHWISNPIPATFKCGTNVTTVQTAKYFVFIATLTSQWINTCPSFVPLTKMEAVITMTMINSADGVSWGRDDKGLDLVFKVTLQINIVQMCHFSNLSCSVYSEATSM